MKKYIKLLLIAMGLIMITPTFTSCKDDKEEDEKEFLNPIVGTWKCEGSEDYSTITFYSDGTILIQRYVYNENKWEVDDYIGIYKISENIITIDMVNGDFPNKKGVYQSANSIISIDGEIFYRL